MKSWLLILTLPLSLGAAAVPPPSDLDLQPPTLHSNRDELIRFLNPDQRDAAWTEPEGNESRWAVVDIPRVSFGSAYNGVLVKNRYQERGPRRWKDACEDAGNLFEAARPFSEVIELGGDAAFAELKQALSDASYDLQKRCERRFGLGGWSHAHFVREIILQNRTGRTLHCIQRVGGTVPDRVREKRKIMESMTRVASVEYLCFLGEVLSGF